MRRVMRDFTDEDIVAASVSIEMDQFLSDFFASYDDEIKPADQSQTAQDKVINAKETLSQFLSARYAGKDIDDFKYDDFSFAPLDNHAEEDRKNLLWLLRDFDHSTYSVPFRVNIIGAYREFIDVKNLRVKDLDNDNVDPNKPTSSNVLPVDVAEKAQKTFSVFSSPGKINSMITKTSSSDSDDVENILDDFFATHDAFFNVGENINDRAANNLNDLLKIAVLGITDDGEYAQATKFSYSDFSVNQNDAKGRKVNLLRLLDEHLKNDPSSSANTIRATIGQFIDPETNKLKQVHNKRIVIEPAQNVVDLDYTNEEPTVSDESEIMTSPLVLTPSMRVHEDIIPKEKTPLILTQADRVHEGTDSTPKDDSNLTNMIAKSEVEMPRALAKALEKAKGHHPSYLKYLEERITNKTGENVELAQSSYVLSKEVADTQTRIPFKMFSKPMPQDYSEPANEEVLIAVPRVVSLTTSGNNLMSLEELTKALNSSDNNFHVETVHPNNGSDPQYILSIKNDATGEWETIIPQDEREEEKSESNHAKSTSIPSGFLKAAAVAGFAVLPSPISDTEVNASGSNFTFTDNTSIGVETTKALETSNIILDKQGTPIATIGSLADAFDTSNLDADVKASVVEASLKPTALLRVAPNLVIPPKIDTVIDAPLPPSPYQPVAQSSYTITDGLSLSEVVEMDLSKIGGDFKTRFNAYVFANIELADNPNFVAQGAEIILPTSLDDASKIKCDWPKNHERSR